MNFGQISLANMTYIRSQNYTNIVVGNYRLQAFDVVVVMLLLMLLSFDVFARGDHYWNFRNHVR
jgi:hypothetical protein